MKTNLHFVGALALLFNIYCFKSLEGQTYRIVFNSPSNLGRYWHATYSESDADTEIDLANNDGFWPNNRVGNWGSDDGLGIISQSSGNQVYVEFGKRNYFGLLPNQDVVNSIPFLVRNGNDSGGEPSNAEYWIDFAIEPPVVKDIGGNIVNNFSIIELGNEEISPMGNSFGLGNLFGTRTRLWADSTGKMSYVHGNVPTQDLFCACYFGSFTDQCKWFSDEGKGMIRYDYSLNGGKTWLKNLNYNWSGGPEDPDCTYDLPLYRWEFDFFNINDERKDSAFFPQAILLPGAQKLVFAAPVTRELNGKWGAYATGSVQPNSNQGIQSISNSNTTEQSAISQLLFSKLEDMAAFNENHVLLIDKSFDHATNEGSQAIIIGHLNSSNNFSNVSTISSLELPNGFLPQKAKLALMEGSSIGYLAVLAQNLNQANGLVSMFIYKTINEGFSWQLLPGPDLTSLATILGIDSILLGGDFDFDIDSENKLHLLVNIGNSTDYADLPDWAQNEFQIVDLKFNQSTEVWSHFIINDSPNSIRIGPYGSGPNQRFDSNRLQISKNEDKSKIFFVWVDSEESDDISIPNVYARAYNVQTNKWTEKTNFTSGTSMANKIHFLDVSSKSILSDGQLFTPAAYSDIENSSSYNINSDNGLILHRFLNLIEFQDSEYTINDFETVISDHGLAQSMNFVYFDRMENNLVVNGLREEALVEFSLFDLSGRQILMNTKTPLASKQLIINASELSNGLYYIKLQESGVTKVLKVAINR